MCQAHEGPVHTFTITFEGFDHYDESAEARLTARHFGTEHHELRATLDGPAMLPAIVESFDEPFGNATAVLIRSLSEVTREHVKVVLAGDGADELFFGYPRYRGLLWADRYRRLSPRALRALAASASRALKEDSSGRHGFRRAREFLSTGALPLVDAYAEWIGYFTPELLRSALLPGLAAEADRVTDFLVELFDGNATLDLNTVSQVELQSFLPYNVLEYADKMSMAHSLELRAPFVDRLLVDYVGTIPAGLKLHSGTSKWVLRQALGDLLPEHVLGGRKRGLNPPLAAWLAGDAKPLVRECLSPAAVRRRGVLRPQAVDGLIAEHESGRRDRSSHIWALLVLELWFQLRVDEAPS
jgi:asparagine synthase (glutamine-hydrolysing)